MQIAGAGAITELLCDKLIILSKIVIVYYFLINVAYHLIYKTKFCC